MVERRTDLTPLPQLPLHLASTLWPRGRVLHRIHQHQYAGDQFNPGARGNARFSPIQRANGSFIPTLYGGSSFVCAAMETVFHDVAFAPGYKHFDKQKLAGQQHSLLVAGADLRLVDLRSTALRKLGVLRRQLIDTEADQYPQTRLWAEAIHAQDDQVQGLLWTSRQDDSAQAVVLFGDRIEVGVLQRCSDGKSLLGDEASYAALLTLAEAIGVCVVAGRGV